MVLVPLAKWYFQKAGPQRNGNRSYGIQGFLLKEDISMVLLLQEFQETQLRHSLYFGSQKTQVISGYFNGRNAAGRVQHPLCDMSRQIMAEAAGFMLFWSRLPRPSSICFLQCGPMVRHVRVSGTHSVSSAFGPETSTTLVD